MTEITIDELSACGCMQCTITNASLDADEATLGFVYEALDSPPVPWAFLEPVTLRGAAGALFTGWVMGRETSWEGGARRYEVTLKGAAALLDAIPARQADDETERLVDAGELAARHLGAYGTCSIGAAILAPYASGTESRWSVITRALRWVPDAASWCDPETGLLSVFRAGATAAPLTLDVRTGRAVDGSGAEVFRFAGVTDITLAPRPDLVPPVCALTGRYNMALPPGGDPWQPYGFVYHVPLEDLTLNGGWGKDGEEELPEDAARAVQRAGNNWVLVKGRKAPHGWETADGEAVNMREPSGLNAEWLAFWQGFGAFRILKRISPACLTFGKAVFEPVPAEEAYPEDDDVEAATPAPSTGKLRPAIEESGNIPANYKEFKANGTDNLYVLTDGQFPASSNARGNVRGLRFCRGCLKQFVWLSSAYSGTAGKEEAQAFFDGSMRLSSGKASRYTCLQLEAVFINRRRKRYQQGTNILAPEDEDYEEEEDDGGGDEGDEDDGDLTEADYAKVLADYYAATRKLYYDGSVTLAGVQGYTPAALMGAGINIAGLAPEWEGMQTTVQRAVYDPMAQTLALTLGSPEALSFDELLHRQQTGLRQRLEEWRKEQDRIQNPKEEEEEDGGEDEGDDGGDESEDEGQAPMVGPAISATHAAAKSARMLEPFQVYYDEDEGAWMLNGGVLPSPAGYIEAEPTNIDSVWKPGRVFAVRARYDSATRAYKPQIVYRDKKP